MDTVEQRLQVLERDLQRSRRTSRVLLLTLVALSCIAATQGETPQMRKLITPGQALSKDANLPLEENATKQDRLRTVEADQFVLLDRLGRARLNMVVNEDGPAISMFDKQGRKRLELGHSDMSSGLRLLDAGESPVVSLKVPDNVGHGQLAIVGSQGSSVMNADGLRIRDADNQPRLHLALLNGKFPVLGISQSDQSGPSSIELTAGDGGRALKIHDKEGYPLYSVFAADNGNTSVRMGHPDHERSLQISTGPQGGLLKMLSSGLFGENMY